MNTPAKIGVVVSIIIVLCVLFFALFTESVPAGHVKVATLFGSVQPDTYKEGMHIVNPLLSFTSFDARQKTRKEVARVPSQDQLTTSVDISVQYRIKREMAALILQDTGTPEQAVEVHMIPKLRSLVREQGKTIKRAEDFFTEHVQQQIQDNLTQALRAYCAPKGLEIETVLIRDVQLPAFIQQAIQEKKQREQKAEEQKAELARFKVEQEQKVAQASAERKAAEEEAQTVMLMADAKAYEIRQINDAVASNSAYIQLAALKALEAIADSPSNQIYFLNGSSPQPLPLMHMGMGMTNGRALLTGSAPATKPAPVTKPAPATEPAPAPEKANGQ